MKTFTVRVYVNGSAPIVLPGGADPLGIYIETRTASGKGAEAIPGKRINVEQSKLRRLPPGSDAEFEFLQPFPSGDFS